MHNYNLIKQKFHQLIPYEIKSFIGKGVHGDVYEIKNNKVIKFSRFESEDFQTCWKDIYESLSYLIENNPLSYANVHECKYLGKIDNNYFYYYVMDKLKPLSEDELRLFSSLFCHGDSGKHKNYSKSKINKMIDVMKNYLDFDANKVRMFDEGVRNSPIQHLDIHTRNIMKDDLNNFRLIDFDRITINH